VVVVAEEAGAAVVAAVLVEEVQVGPGKILKKEEEIKLVELISKLEHETTGEVRIHLTKHVSKHGVMTDAQTCFDKLGMNKTKDRNGVLLYIAVSDKQLACIGDAGIHAKVHTSGWQALVTEITGHFAKGEFFAGLYRAIEKIGSFLNEYFPQVESANPNELPNTVSYDEDSTS